MPKTRGKRALKSWMGNLFICYLKYITKYLTEKDKSCLIIPTYADVSITIISANSIQMNQHQRLASKMELHLQNNLIIFVNCDDFSISDSICRFAALPRMIMRGPLWRCIVRGRPAIPQTWHTNQQSQNLGSPKCKKPQFGV